MCVHVVVFQSNEEFGQECCINTLVDSVAKKILSFEHHIMTKGIVYNTSKLSKRGIDQPGKT